MTGVQQDCGGCLVLGVQGTYTSELTGPALAFGTLGGGVRIVIAVYLRGGLCKWGVLSGRKKNMRRSRKK